MIVEWYNFPLHVPLIIFQPHRYNSAHLTLNCNEFVNDTVSIEWLIGTWISCTIRWATHRTALHFFQEKSQILPCFFLWVLIFFLSCWFLYNGCENKDLNQTKSFEKGSELSIHKTLHFFSIVQREKQLQLVSYILVVCFANKKLNLKQLIMIIETEKITFCLPLMNAVFITSSKQP